MPDDADRAAELAELSERELASRVEQRRAAGRAAPRPECVACGADIGAARRAAMPGCRLCVACQAGVEQGTRL